jgi:hypothetical protein
MRPLLGMLLVGLASGCAQRTAEYYRASAPEGVVETNAQACAGPTAIYSFPIADGVVGSIQAHPAQSGVVVSWSLSLKENRTVRLGTADVLMYDVAEKAARGEVTKFEISVFGRDGKPGQIETFEPQSELKGLNRNPTRQIASVGQVDTFRTNVQIGRDAR